MKRMYNLRAFDKWYKEQHPNAGIFHKAGAEAGWIEAINWVIKTLNAVEELDEWDRPTGFYEIYEEDYEKLYKELYDE